MARPTQSPEEKIENAFYDLPAERQAGLLRMLNRLHDLKQRQPDKPKVGRPKKAIGEQQKEFQASE